MGKATSLLAKILLFLFFLLFFLLFFPFSLPSDYQNDKKVFHPCAARRMILSVCL